MYRDSNALTSSYALSKIDNQIPSLAELRFKDSFYSSLSAFDLSNLVDIVFNAAFVARDNVHRYPLIAINKFHLPSILGYHI